MAVLALAACGGDDSGGGGDDTAAAATTTAGATTDGGATTTAGAETDGGATTTDPAAQGSELPAETGPIGQPAGDEGAPVDGGVLRVMVEDGDPGGMDPIRQLGSGQTGLVGESAIYGTLMRYDPVANEYVPQMAESLSANADYTEYTLTLRPDVTFTDGTPLNAAAVKSGFERFSGPGSLLIYASIFPQIVSMETPDDLTVVITLDGPDPSFPFLLTQTFGQVVSPTAAEAQGPEDFNRNPVGAGPFMVESYEPGVKLSLVRNPDYWGPAPHLDGIEFTWVSDHRARVEALANGDVDLITIADPIASQSAFEEGFNGFGWLTYGSPVFTMNMREGYPLADQRLRLAVAQALDPETINARAFGGFGYPSKALFPAGLLSSGTEGVPTDPDGARALVQEVKDETGWDGSFTLISSQEPSMHDAALSAQAMLNNVGFDVSVETPPNYLDLVYTQFDYDAVITALGMVETDPYVFFSYEAGGEYSPSGLSDPRLDAAILELRAAATPAETEAATATIQNLWNEINPSAWLGYRMNRTFYASNVHGVVPTASTAVLLHEAWLTD